MFAEYTFLFSLQLLTLLLNKWMASNIVTVDHMRCIVFYTHSAYNFVFFLNLHIIKI